MDIKTFSVHVFFTLNIYLQISYICTADRQAWLLHPRGGSFAEVLDCSGREMPYTDAENKFSYILDWVVAASRRCAVIDSQMFCCDTQRQRHWAADVRWLTGFLWCEVNAPSTPSFNTFIDGLITVTWVTGGQLASFPHRFRVGNHWRSGYHLESIGQIIIAYCIQRVQIYSCRTIHPSEKWVRSDGRLPPASHAKAYPPPLTSEGS